MPHAAGVDYGIQGDAGTGLGAGVTATGSTGWGVFSKSDPLLDPKGISTGQFATGGTSGYGPGGQFSKPENGQSSAVLGAYAGEGPGLWTSNARSVQDLQGPFKTDSVNVGFDGVQLGIQFSYGDNPQGDPIWDLSLSPPGGPGGGVGLSASSQTTVTKVKS